MARPVRHQRAPARWIADALRFDRRPEGESPGEDREMPLTRSRFQHSSQKLVAVRSKKVSRLYTSLFDHRYAAALRAISERRSESGPLKLFHRDRRFRGSQSQMTSGVASISPVHGLL